MQTEEKVLNSNSYFKYAISREELTDGENNLDIVDSSDTVSCLVTFDLHRTMCLIVSTSHLRGPGAS